MPKMTREEAIDYLTDGLIPDAVLNEIRHNEAYCLAIEALRDLSEQRCTTCDVNQLRIQLNALKEALKAMERERDQWADECELEQYANLDTIRQYQHRLSAAESELSDLRAKVEGFRAWMRTAWSFVQKSQFEDKLCELFSFLDHDPVPDPTPKMWAWALEELKENRMVTDGKVVVRRSRLAGRIGDDLVSKLVTETSWVFWKSSIQDFTKAKWLPCEEEK